MPWFEATWLPFQIRGSSLFESGVLSSGCSLWSRMVLFFDLHADSPQSLASIRISSAFNRHSLRLAVLSETSIWLATVDTEISFKYRSLKRS
jgi:hypothetical protein